MGKDSDGLKPILESGIGLTKGVTPRPLLSEVERT